MSLVPGFQREHTWTTTLTFQIKLVVHRVVWVSNQPHLYASNELRAFGQEDFDRILKETSVDSSLLADFHAEPSWNTPRLGTHLPAKGVLMAGGGAGGAGNLSLEELMRRAAEVNPSPFRAVVAFEDEEHLPGQRAGGARLCWK